jgi:hypothetical protein
MFPGAPVSTVSSATAPIRMPGLSGLWGSNWPRWRLAIRQPTMTGKAQRVPTTAFMKPTRRSFKGSCSFPRDPKFPRVTLNRSGVSPWNGGLLVWSAVGHAPPPDGGLTHQQDYQRTPRPAPHLLDNRLFSTSESDALTVNS